MSLLLLLSAGLALPARLTVGSLPRRRRQPRCYRKGCAVSFSSLAPGCTRAAGCSLIALDSAAGAVGDCAELRWIGAKGWLADGRRCVGLRRGRARRAVRADVGLPRGHVPGAPSDHGIPARAA